MLKRINRLKKKREFSFIYRKGKSYHTKYLSLYVTQTRLKYSKIGFSISNKVGNSVVRHKIKRRLAEIIKSKIEELGRNNYVFIAKIGSNTLSYTELCKNVETLMIKVQNEK